MTREEAIEILVNHTQYKCNGNDLVALDMAIEALEPKPISPCNVCRYNPPGSGDGKPCSMCPAQAIEIFKDKLESGYFRKRGEV